MSSAKVSEEGGSIVIQGRGPLGARLISLLAFGHTDLQSHELGVGDDSKWYIKVDGPAAPRAKAPYQAAPRAAKREVASHWQKVALVLAGLSLYSAGAGRGNAAILLAALAVGVGAVHYARA